MALTPGAEAPIRTGRHRVPRPAWMAFLVGLVIGLVSTLAGVALFRGAGDGAWEPGELVILSGQDDSPGGQRQALVDLWNALNPAHPARIDVLKEAADGQRAEMAARARAKARVDIYNLDVTWMAEFADHYLRPIDESALPRPLRDGFLDKPMSTCVYERQLWGLPFNTDAGVLFYRSDLVTPPTQAGGVPRLGWQTIADATRRLPELRRKEPRLAAGYTGQLAGYEGLTVNAMEAIWAARGEVVDDRGTVAFDPKTWQTGLARLAVAPADAPGAGVILKDSLGFDETHSREAFAAGRVLFMRNWPVAHRNLSNSEAGGAAPSVKFGMALLPGDPALGGQNLAISKHTERPRAAQALIEFLTSEPSQRLLFERGGFAPTQKAVYDNPAVKKDNPYVSVLRAAVDEARLRPVTPHYAHFSRTFREEVQRAMQNGGAVSRDFGRSLSGALRGQ